MSGIYGLLNRSAADDTLINTIGQRIVFDASQEYIARIEADLARAISVFVEADTEDYKERYKLPGGGRMQRRNQQSGGGAVRQYGEWDVAYPLEDFDDQIAVDDVEFAYLTLQEYQLHLDTIQTRYINTVRFEFLQKLWKNTNTTFVDPRKGSLTVVPLANGDAVTYPPVLGSEDEATDDHYLETGYAATAISDTNNPYVTIKEELVEHFGETTGGENIAVFINPAEQPETDLLTDYTPVVDRFVRAGDDVDVPENLPNVPGIIQGRCNGVWVVQWRWIPAGYMLGVHLEAPAPLKRRLDPAATGLPRGLALVSDSMGDYPFREAHWRARFGFGVGNRLNGVALKFGNDGSYTIPTAYA